MSLVSTYLCALQCFPFSSPSQLFLYMPHTHCDLCVFCMTIHVKKRCKLLRIWGWCSSIASVWGADTLYECKFKSQHLHYWLGSLLMANKSRLGSWVLGLLYPCEISGRNFGSNFRLLQLWLLRSFGEWTKGWTSLYLSLSLEPCLPNKHRKKVSEVSNPNWRWQSRSLGRAFVIHTLSRKIQDCRKIQLCRFECILLI